MTEFHQSQENQHSPSSGKGDNPYAPPSTADENEQIDVPYNPAFRLMIGFGVLAMTSLLIYSQTGYRVSAFLEILMIGLTWGAAKNQ